jgi:hypothetical protein
MVHATTDRWQHVLGWSMQQPAGQNLGMTRSALHNRKDPKISICEKFSYVVCDLPTPLLLQI